MQYLLEEFVAKRLVRYAPVPLTGRIASAPKLWAATFFDLQKNTRQNWPLSRYMTPYDLSASHRPSLVGETTARVCPSTPLYRRQP
jgi:hypothetical protein